MLRLGRTSSLPSSESELLLILQSLPQEHRRSPKQQLATKVPQKIPKAIPKATAKLEIEITPLETNKEVEELIWKLQRRGLQHWTFYM